jgi:hypothetical protein
MISIDFFSPATTINQLLKLLSTQAQAKYLLRSQRDVPEKEKSDSGDKKSEPVKKRGFVSSTLRCYRMLTVWWRVLLIK